MQPISARLIAFLVSAILAGLARIGLGDIGPELTGALTVWVQHSFEPVLLIGYLLIHPRLERKGAP